MKKTYFLITSLFISLAFISCSDDDDTPTPISVNFSATEAGISSSNTSAEVQVVFSRPTESVGSLSLTLNAGSLNYGTDADFYTNPEVVDGVLVLNYEAGVGSVSFDVLAGEGLNITEDEVITLTIDSPDGSLLLGQSAVISVTFGENFVAQSGAAVELNAGGAGFPNQVFFDISKNKATSIDRYAWDLGLSSQDENHVILNGAGQVMARAIDKTDLTAVTAADTLGFGAVMAVPNYNPASGAVGWIDDHTGDMEQTAFGDIASSEAEASVFIVRREGEGRNWKKVRVYSSGTGYTVEYADIDSEDFESVTIEKDEAYNFTYFNLDDGIQQEEMPTKESFDFVYSRYAVRFQGVYAYGFNDYITINRYNTEVAMVMIDAETTYETFTYEDALAASYSSALNAIGSDWRIADQSTTKVADDRFFVIKDAEDHYYKVAFIAMKDINGERGQVTFSFELL